MWPLSSVGLRGTRARLGIAGAYGIADHVITIGRSCVMNRSFLTKLEGKSAISVAFLFALAVPLAAEGPDPRQRTGP